jgi:excinuclease UvrABC helicase subunit UvrB
MKDLFALLLGGDLFGNTSQSSMTYPKDDDPNWSKTVESFETKTHLIKKEVWTSKDGNYRMERMVSEIKRKVDVRRLKIQLQRALENEDYEKAAELRDKINSLNQ